MSTIAYSFRAVSDAGALVSGATVRVGATTLTAGTPTSVTGQQLASASSLSCTVTYYDRGNGDYVLLYDPVAGGEAYIPLTISKSGVTITNGNALIGLTCPADSGLIVATNTNAATAATQSTTAATQATSAATSAATAAMQATTAATQSTAAATSAATAATQASTAATQATSAASTSSSIKAKTDNLPASPASTSDVQPTIVIP